MSPRDWKYTWEAQSQMPILKLFLFSENVSPSKDCKEIEVDLKFEKSILVVTWMNEQGSVILTVPVPRVLVDLEAPVNFRVLEDYVEIKLLLLLPVDHPIVSSFISDLNLELEVQSEHSYLDFWHPLVLDSDVETLSSKGVVHFYCKNCSFNLTERGIRSFMEMPSVDWREVADNWFGSCCCSFGGVSEKLVANYAKTYSSTEGKCLLTTTSVILHHADLTGFSLLSCNGSEKHSDHDSFNVKEAYRTETVHNFDQMSGLLKLREEDNIASDGNDAVKGHLTEDYVHTSTHRCFMLCQHDFTLNNQESSNVDNLSANQKLHLNGYLGNMFMLKLSGLSKEVEWVDFACPCCSYLLGAYPRTNSHQPIDGGIRLLKCFISSSLPVGSSGDLFSKYTLERMFSAQIMEIANEELSFRIKLKDLKTKISMLQMVLLNPNCWSYSGSCTEGGSVAISPKIYLCPVIKVLSSASAVEGELESRSRLVREVQNQIEEMFMLEYPIELLMKSLKSYSRSFPPSLRSLESFSVSYLPR